MNNGNNINNAKFSMLIVLGIFVVDALKDRISQIILSNDGFNIKVD